MRIQNMQSYGVTNQLAFPATTAPAATATAPFATYERASSNPLLTQFVASQTSVQQQQAEAQGDADLQFAGTVPLFDQNIVADGNANGCGTTSLAMVLASFGIIPPTYEAAAQVDAQVRGWGGFTAPDDLQAYAQSQGFNSEGDNNASLNDLMKATADPANRVMVMVDGGGSPHWEVCLGVTVDPKTQQTSVVLADPENPYGTETVSAATFLGQWKDPFATSNDGAEVAGYSHYMQVFSTHALASGGDADIATTQNVLHDLTGTANSAVGMINALGQGDIGGAIGDFGSMITDGFHAANALPWIIGQAAGNAVAVATGAPAPVAAAVAAVTTAATPGGVDNVVDSAVTQATGSSVVGAVVAAVVDPVGAVVNAISNFFGSL